MHAANNKGGQMGRGERQHAARSRWPALQQRGFAVDDCETLRLQAGGRICWQYGVGEAVAVVEVVGRLRVMEWPARATGRAAG